MSEFIKNLKVGDTVVVSTRFDMFVRKVDRITKAGNIGVGGMLFNQSGIERNGDLWSKASLYEATPELLSKIRKDQTIKAAIRLMRYTKEINLEQAIEIIKILTPQKQENIT